MFQAYGVKACGLCQSKTCKTGAYVKLPNNEFRQKWVCSSCIVKGNSTFIKQHIELGTLNASAEQRGRVLPTCPLDCAKNSPRGATCALLGASKTALESKMK